MGIQVQPNCCGEQTFYSTTKKFLTNRFDQFGRWAKPWGNAANGFQGDISVCNPVGLPGGEYRLWGFASVSTISSVNPFNRQRINGPALGPTWSTVFSVVVDLPNDRSFFQGFHVASNAWAVAKGGLHGEGAANIWVGGRSGTNFEIIGANRTDVSQQKWCPALDAIIAFKFWSNTATLVISNCELVTLTPVGAVSVLQSLADGTLLCLDFDPVEELIFFTYVDVFGSGVHVYRIGFNGAGFTDIHNPSILLGDFETGGQPWGLQVDTARQRLIVSKRYPGFYSDPYFFTMDYDGNGFDLLFPEQPTRQAANVDNAKVWRFGEPHIRVDENWH